MEIEIEETIKKINNLIDNTDKDFKAHEVMQLSQSALNLVHTAVLLSNINREGLKNTAKDLLERIL